MTAVTVEGVANDDLLLQKSVGDNNRRSTDKNWIDFFLFVFVIWICSWHFLIHYENYNFDLYERRTKENLPKFTDNYENDPDDCTDTDDLSVYVSSYWGKCWFFDTITFNVGFLNVHYETSGSIVIWANVLFCVGLIIYGLASMPADDIFCNQIKYFGRPLLAFLFYYRFLMYIPNRSYVMLFIPYDKKITFWILPELVCFIVWFTRWKSDKNDDHDKKISFYKFVGYVGLIGITLFASLEILILKTTAHTYELGWDNPLFYLIVGGSCYVGLTFFYFGLMVIACATGLSFDSQKTSFKDLYRAFRIVGRYHFGTACYLATVIFPRIRDTFVIYESEFREIPESTATRRFWLTHCKIYNSSPILTALSGRNHTSSIRELLRISNADSSKVKQFQGFAKVSKTFSAIIIGTNSLILIMLWVHGAMINPRFMMGTWVMYLVVLFFNYIFMRAHDAAADTIWLHVDEQQGVKF